MDWLLLEALRSSSSLLVEQKIVDEGSYFSYVKAPKGEFSTPWRTFVIYSKSTGRNVHVVRGTKGGRFQTQAIHFYKKEGWDSSGACREWIERQRKKAMV